MKILLDTCSFLWLVTDNKDRLSQKAIEIFLDEDNEIFFSIVSAWEISIKASIGKLSLGRPVKTFLSEQLKENELKILPIRFEHVVMVSDFPFYHKDPFDRLLIAQSIIEDIPILSNDENFRNYHVKTVWQKQSEC